jgi:MSHA biogenesis protein MshE
MASSRPRYGESLIVNKLITSEQLDKLLQKQKSEGGKLNKLLIEMGYIEEDKLLAFLESQLNIRLLDLKSYILNPEMIRKLPETLSRRYQVVVLEETSENYLVGMVDPQDVVAVDEITRYLQRPIVLALVRERDWVFVMDSVYLHTEEISNYAKELSAEVGPQDRESFIEANRA